MQTIQVTQDFVLSLEDGTKRAFKAGVHEVDDAIAEHWYVKAHSRPVEEPAAVSEPDNPTPAASAASATGDTTQVSGSAKTPPPNKPKK